METITIVDRIKELCEEKHITISELERICKFANGTIKKWNTVKNPGSDKIIKIANYFGVTTVYLLGRTTIRSSVDEIMNDSDIISLQRAKSRMSPAERERMMQMLKIGFDYAFRDDD